MIRTHPEARARDTRPVPVRFLVFLRERFPPAFSLPLTCLFAAAGLVPAASAMGLAVDPPRMLAASAVVGLSMLHLRMVDELKDADVDRRGRPDRPLPRGLVTERELTLAAALALAAAAAFAVALGRESLLWFLPAVGYVALADVQFFAPGRVHRDLVVYALVHSPIIALLMVFAWSAAGPGAPLGILPGLAILAWGVGLGLEVTRKTYAPDEERPFVETYSSALGRHGALRLAAAALSIAALGGALYAWSAGSSAPVIAAPLVAALAIPAGVMLLHDARRRTIEGVGTILGVVALAWPIVVAVAVGGAVR